MQRNQVIPEELVNAPKRSDNLDRTFTTERVTNKYSIIINDIRRFGVI